MIARTRALLLVPALVVSASIPQDSLTHRHPTLLAGDYWTHLSTADKQVYLSGFLAGAAAEQARGMVAAAHPDDDTTAVASTVDSLRVRHALHLTFAPQVYIAQLDDFYWWSNHSTVPIVDALITVNAMNVHR
jgi:hypothetical protein